MTTTTDPTAMRLTTAELAAALGLSVKHTRRLLAGGCIPGARKFDPSRSGSHYYIPADAPARFREAC